MLKSNSVFNVTAACAQVLGYDMTRIRERDVPYLRRKLGIVFQDFQLLTDRSVRENLDFVLRATGWKSKDDMEARVEEVLAQVGMSKKAYRMPHELSGGEQQRIAIARALLNNPQIILADEPTGNLDPQTGKQIVDLLYRISKSGTAVIMSTHNLSFCDEFPGRIYRCEGHRLGFRLHGKLRLHQCSEGYRTCQPWGCHLYHRLLSRLRYEQQ